MHAVDTENLARGLRLDPAPHDEKFESEFPVKLVGPYGCAVTCVYEGMEKPKSEKKFTGRAWEGFHCGYSGKNAVKVGYPLKDGSFDYVISQNVKVYPNKQFFAEPPTDILRYQRTRVQVLEDDKLTWVLVTCCHKWREIAGNEREAMNELEQVECADVGCTCDIGQDPRAFENFHIEIVLDNDVYPEAYAFEGVTKRVAFGETEWFGSGKTHADVMKPAKDKEMSSFVRNKTFAMGEVQKRSWVRKNRPNAKIVLTNLIMGTKGAEHWHALSAKEKIDIKLRAEALLKMKAKGRLVAYKELWAKDLSEVGTGMDKGETSISNTPSYPAMRIASCISAIAEQESADADVDTAYQKAPNRERELAWCQLPTELWPPEWFDIYDLKDPPLVPIVGSLYGRVRAAPDYDYFADSATVLSGWTPLRDVEPCLYVKKSKTSKNKVPNSCIRYADDFRVSTAVGELKGEMENLNKKLPFGDDPKPSNGEKYVGVKTHITKLPDGRIKIVNEQKDLLAKTVNEFLEDCKSRGIVCKDRRTPEPSTDIVVPCTREQEQVRAERAAAKEEKLDGVGVFKEACLHYVNSIAFIERGTRADISACVQKLQSMAHNWTTESDRLLAWLMGYLNATRDRVLTGYVSPEDLASNALYILAQSDASHASEKSTRKSVAGWCIWLKGPNTSVLLEWGTKILPVITLSSMESEVIAALMCIKRLIQVSSIVNILLGLEDADVPSTGVYDTSKQSDGIPETLQMDAMAAINAIRRAGSGKVRHLRRVQGVSLYWIHQYFDVQEKRTLEHRSGKELAADAFTKGLSYDVLLTHLRELGMDGLNG